MYSALPSSLTQSLVGPMTASKSTGRKGNLLIKFLFENSVFKILYFVERNKKEQLKHRAFQSVSLDSYKLSTVFTKCFSMKSLYAHPPPTLLHQNPKIWF